MEKLTEGMILKEIAELQLRRDTLEKKILGLRQYLNAEKIVHGESIIPAPSNK